MKHDTKTYFKIIINIILFLVGVVFIVWVLPKLIIYFMPFIIALIIALIAAPIVKFIEKHLKLKRKASLFCVIIIIITLITGCMYGVISLLVSSTRGIFNELPHFWETFSENIKTMMNNIESSNTILPKDTMDIINKFIENCGKDISKYITTLSKPTLAVVGNVAKGIPNAIVFTIMSFLATYIFVTDGDELYEKTKAYIPAKMLARLRVVKYSLVHSVVGYFKAQFKIEIWVYFVILIGLFILQIPYAIFIAFIIAFLDLLPIFGTGAVLWPWTAISALNGDYFTAIGLLILWGIAQLIRQFIQPKYVGETLGVEPLPTLILLYIGYKVGSILGLILAVPIGILLTKLYQEGMFENIEKTIKILFTRIDKFRQYDEEESAEINTKKQSKPSELDEKER